MSDGNKKKNSTSAVAYSQQTIQRYMISYNAQCVMCREQEGGGEEMGGSCEKGNERGGVCLHVSHSGYWKHTDAVHHE